MMIKRERKGGRELESVWYFALLDHNSFRNVCLCVCLCVDGQVWNCRFDQWNKNKSPSVSASVNDGTFSGNHKRPKSIQNTILNSPCSLSKEARLFFFCCCCLAGSINQVWDFRSVFEKYSMYSTLLKDDTMPYYGNGYSILFSVKLRVMCLRKKERNM